jgi:subtilisin family serine protease
MIRRRAVLGALSAVVASVVVVLAAGGGVAAESNTNLRAATVHPQLLEQLQANPTGGLPATITAWNRESLDEIQAIAGGAKLRLLPMVLTKTLTKSQFDALVAMPAVRSIYPDRKYKVTMEDTTWITKARYVWASSGPSALPGFGVTGRNVELAVIDTGVDGKHEDADNLVEFCEAAVAISSDRSTVACSPYRPTAGNFGPAGPCAAAATAPVPTTTQANCFGTGMNAARFDSTDDEGHGSHVFGTVAGSGHASGGTSNTHSTTGMSPHARVRAYSANIATALLDQQILGAYDDLTWKKEHGFNNVIAVNNSWGGGNGYSPSDPITIAVKRAYVHGILSVFAAGNDGHEHDTLSSQCVIPVVVCVAATTKPDSIVMFSSRGRPSQPTDTNRDGQINGADVQPDNHDRRIGQALDIGVYRPTLAAPGVNINSISANSGGCREDVLIENPVEAGCYEQLNGTSMATPHVTGAVGLVAQAFRQERGRLPRPDEIADILERSANVVKLPAWEADEQGAGRLDVHEAVKIAKRITNPKRPNFGHPTPSYVPGKYPKGPDQDPEFSAKGCTAAGSWSFKDVDTDPDEPLPDPPVGAGPFYGQHLITVQPKTERLRITVRWREAANLYVRLWRPGVDPNADVNPAGPRRTYPDNEAIGLLGPDGLPFFGPERLIEVRSPEVGTWTLRVYHRVGEASGCGDTNETPPQPARSPAVEYDVLAELPLVTHQPSVVIDGPSSASGRFVEIRGRAGYPPDNTPPNQDPPDIGNVGHSWEGITNWEAPNSNRTAPGDADPNPANPRDVLYFHGNMHDAGTGASEEALCPPDGEAATLLVACSGPLLLKSSTLSPNAAASWKGDAVEWAFDGVSPGGDRTIFDPHWVWCLVDLPTCHAESPAPGAQTVAGAMTVEWWAQCGPLCFGGGPEWWIRLWADGVLKFEQQVSVGPLLPNVPERLRATVSLPTITANQRLTLHVEPVFLVNQFLPFFIYYDSESPCVAGVTTGRCDSLVRMPAHGSGGTAGSGPAPDNIRVTDLPANAPYPSAPQTPALRVAWDPQSDVGGYRVYRSTDPTTLGVLRYGGPGQPCPGDPDGAGPQLGTSPEAPGTDTPSPTQDAPPGHDRTGLCFTDTAFTNASFLTTFYYRVLSVRNDQESSISDVAYGAPTRYDRQVKLKVDRLYGPQHWEYALLASSPTPPDTTNSGTSWRFLWDTLELAPGAHDVFARSFTQGIGSQNAQRSIHEPDPPPPPDPPDPGCPDDDDGDGDDDADDGDSDDDGDDGDDDCEDDDDDEEEEDD